MTAEEIVRRLRFLLALPPNQRPITIDRLEKVAGISPNQVQNIAEHFGTLKMQEKTRSRLSKALTWVENDQLVIKQRERLPNGQFGGGVPEITIRDPKPPQKIVPCVEITKNGPRVKFLVTNPRSLTTVSGPKVDTLKFTK